MRRTIAVTSLLLLAAVGVAALGQNDQGTSSAGNGQGVAQADESGSRRSGLVDLLQAARAPSQSEAPTRPQTVVSGAPTEIVGTPNAFADDSASEAEDLQTTSRRPYRNPLSNRGTVPEDSSASTPETVTAETLPTETASSAPETVTPPTTLPQSAPLTRATESEPTTIPTQVPSTSTSIAPSTLTDGAEAIITGSSPLLSLVTTGPRTVVVGKDANYVVTIRNEGNTTANHVAVEVQVPAGAELQGTNAGRGTAHYEGAINQAGRIRWDIGNLDAQAEAMLVISLVPRNPRAFDLAVAWAATPTMTAARVEVLQPQVNVALSGPTEVHFGEETTYQITVSNPGTGEAENVMIHLNHTGGAQSSPGTRNIGNLAAGEQKEVSITLLAQQEGIMPVQVNVVADGDLHADCARDILVRRGHLEMALEGPQAKFAGTAASYRVRIVNTGNATAQTVTSAANLPAGAVFISCTGGGQFNEETQQVEWPIGSMQPGDVLEFEVQCLLQTAGQNRASFVSRAGGGLEAAQAVLTEVEALADLKMELVDPVGPVEVGSDAIYEIHISNRGTKAAENVQVYAFFEDGLEPVAAHGAAAEIANDGSVIFQPIIHLAAGQEMVLRVTARSTATGYLRFRSEVECSDPDTRLAAEETTRYYGTAVSDESQRAANTPVLPEQGLGYPR